jgi:hypothetical protein
MHALAHSDAIVVSIKERTDMEPREAPQRPDTYSGTPVEFEYEPAPPAQRYTNAGVTPGGVFALCVLAVLAVVTMAFSAVLLLWGIRAFIELAAGVLL